MEKVLNFGKTDKPKLKELFKKFPEKKTKTAFEEKRVEIEKTTVTLYNTGKVVIQGNNSEKVKKMLLKEMNLEEEIVLGIDEVGRSELTGPFIVSFVLGNSNALREVRDSKKTRNLKEKYGLISSKSLMNVSFSLNSALIDRLRGKGLTLDEIEAKIINNTVDFFNEIEEKVKVKADGKGFSGTNKRVEFIVKGDDLEPVIGAASIVSKYLREISEDKGKRKSWKNA